ncbi:MAG TPA: hypothetical protein VNO32_16150 [Candidatus Acidoferrum sp.]|nr:hypothetical protein [Candidatus Acidoferrum sp.]
MENLRKILASSIVAVATIGSLSSGAALAQDESTKLTPHNNGYNIHVFPTVTRKGTLPPQTDPGPLVYHGGPVMQGGATPYLIFWVPAKLQNGKATTMSAHYQAVEKNMLGDYVAHGIDNNNTQYYQQVSGVKSYIQNKGTAAISTVDTDPFPASGCTDTDTPGACITDTQLQAEIKKVMALKKWTGGLSKMFFVFTSSGEGSCFDSSGSSCAYTAYCAYHGYFLSGTTPVVYANEPYGDLNNCQVAGTPSPNNDPVADATATSASHEFTEAITDPELNSWFTAQGNEIGDLCAYDYGLFYNWDAGNANQMWNGRFYMLQTEYDNNQLACVQVGP